MGRFFNEVERLSAFARYNDVSEGGGLGAIWRRDYLKRGTGDDHAGSLY